MMPELDRNLFKGPNKRSKHIHVCVGLSIGMLPTKNGLDIAAQISRRNLSITRNIGMADRSWDDFWKDIVSIHNEYYQHTPEEASKIDLLAPTNKRVFSYLKRARNRFKQSEVRLVAGKYINAAKLDMAIEDALA